MVTQIAPLDMIPGETSDLETIHDFLAQKRIAVVGVSRNEGSFSVALFEELRRRGYEVVPVNPRTPELLGRRCSAHVQDKFSLQSMPRS